MPLGYATIHDVNDDAKVAELVASMRANGWAGMPIVVWDDKALTGVHRLAACEITGIQPETIDLADVFAEAGENFDDAVADYLDYYDRSPNADWDSGITERIYPYLSSKIQNKYGIQY